MRFGALVRRLKQEHQYEGTSGEEPGYKAKRVDNCM